MKAAQTVASYPVRIFDVTVSRASAISANFRRITFAGPSLHRFGVQGPSLDLRIKLLLPVPGHLQFRPGSPDGALYEGWYQDWLQVEQPSRGFIRSYTVRTIRTTPDGCELDVDFFLHAGAGGLTAPASDWARTASPGTHALLVGPDAITTGTPLPSETGIRWAPQNARRVLLAGDETAVPAISSILEALPADMSGHAFLEVPDATDVQDLATNSSVETTWLVRNVRKARRGHLLCDAVERAAGLVQGHSHGVTPLYAWVAAEAETVKVLRRFLVNKHGLDPKRSEFRGYWRLSRAGSGVNGTPLSTVQPCAPAGTAPAERRARDI